MSVGEPEPGASETAAPPPEPPDQGARRGAPESSQSEITKEALTEAFAQGIGGSRGIIDSSLPTAVFVVAYLITGSQLAPSLWAAVAAGIVVAVLRRIRGESLQHILAGLVGVGIAAVLAARTGRAEDFFVPGLIINVVYGAGFAVSALVKRPLVGYAAGAIVGDLTAWWRDPAARAAATLATWLWVGVYGLRLVVQVPLYFAGDVAALGIVKLAMSWPLFALAAYLSYRIMAPSMRRLRDGEPS